MLLRQNPSAGRSFCACLSPAAPSERVADLITALRDHLLSSSPSQSRAAAGKGSKRHRGRKQGSAAGDVPEVDESAAAEVKTVLALRGNECAIFAFLLCLATTSCVCR